LGFMGSIGVSGDRSWEVVGRVEKEQEVRRSMLQVWRELWVD
nr:hypothetical protein [Tanacetum cinerariifolium]